MSNEATVTYRDRYNVGQPAIYAFNVLVVAATALLWVQAYSTSPSADAAGKGPIAAAVSPGSPVGR